MEWGISLLSPNLKEGSFYSDPYIGVMDMSDLAALIAAQEAPVAKRGPYRKRAA
jgi:hypothetical protein